MHCDYDSFNDMDEYPEETTEDVLFSVCLFDLIPLFSYVTDYETSSFKIFRLPLWETRKINDEKNKQFKTRYYILKLPIFETIAEYKY